MNVGEHESPAGIGKGIGCTPQSAQLIYAAVSIAGDAGRGGNAGGEKSQRATFESEVVAVLLILKNSC